MNNNSMIEKKESLLRKIINKIKVFFKSETEETTPKVYIPKNDIKGNDEKNEFFNNIKIQIDAQNNELYALKIKLESGEIKAIDLTDEQIDKLQEIYDEEIKQKKIGSPEKS